MDKMTHVKFNFNNFLMGFSLAFDKVFKKNIYGISYNSKRIAYMALRLSSYTHFSAEHFSDLSSYSLLYKLDIPLEHLKQMPFIEQNIYQDKDIKNILKLSNLIEDNINIEHNMIVNKDAVIDLVVKNDNFDNILKENFSDLSSDMTFWLDLTNDCQMPFYIYNFLQDFTIEIEYDKLIKLSEIINEIIFAYTNNKNTNDIAIKCKEMCQIYNFDNKDTSRMIIAASLHSIGKLFIPKEIYYKSNILTKEEIDMLKAIPYFSHSILSSIFGFDDIAKLCSLYNERLDGTGTPYELDASNLSLKDRLLAILVIYQALLEEKVYRKAFCHEEAIEILKKEASANKLDLSIVEDLDRKYQIKK
jgi:HD-GYP domain-containing protein (c-di-GMP phosphodiesterase class II)